MTITVFYKLLAIFLTVGLGWVAGRLRWLETGAGGGDPARLLGNAAFTIFVPALLFRTTVRLDFASMPWRTVAAFFVPALLFVAVVYMWQRRTAGPGAQGAAAPSVRAISAVFGNSVQVGIPLAAALFGEAGLAIHIALVSLHAIILLSLLTVLAELDVGRHRAATGQASRLWPMLRQTLRNTIVHPVVLPVLAGLLWNATGLGLAPVLDETLTTLGSAVVPVCLVLIGLTLAYSNLKGQWQGAIGVGALKLLGLPALVLATAQGVFGLAGLPLSVVVMMAALPVGSNALMFSQRYDSLQAETTAAIMISTVAFAATGSLWLALLAWLA
ncbi:MAG: AEC family transporter [Rubrivivax sp.]|nr:AEC family transporter [Rubrivivax sp.]